MLIAITAIGILVLKNSEEKDSIKEDNTSKVVEKNEVTNNKNDEKDVDYKGIIKKFLVACDSEDDMNDFVDEYADIKSMYVADKIDEPSEFEDEYKKTKAEDCEDYADDVKEVYSSFVSEDTELTLKKVGKATKMSEIGIDMWSDVRFTVESDGETLELAAIFCGDKLVLISDEDTVDSLYENLKEEEENVTNTSKNTTNDTSNNTTNKTSNKTSNSSSDDEEE